MLPSHLLPLQPDRRQGALVHLNMPQRPGCHIWLSHRLRLTAVRISAFQLDRFLKFILYD